MKNFDNKNTETMSRTNYFQKEVVILFAYQPPDTNKTMLFNEICITLNKKLGKYDNILKARGLYTDEPKTGSDSSRHLSNAMDSFNLTNLVNKRTCFKLQD